VVTGGHGLYRQRISNLLGCDALRQQTQHLKLAPREPGNRRRTCLCVVV
jgi:hypothetical protein